MISHLLIDLNNSNELKLYHVSRNTNQRNMRNLVQILIPMISTRLPEPSESGIKDAGIRTDGGIINAINSNEYYYPEHRAPLGILCNFNGSCEYKVNGFRYETDDHSFFISNKGASIEINQKAQHQVESFYLFYGDKMVNEAVSSRIIEDQKLLEDPEQNSMQPFEFVDRTYPYEGRLATKLLNLRHLVKSTYSDQALIHEIKREILDELWCIHHTVEEELSKIDAAKPATRKEIYKRLYLAKDFMDSHIHQKVSLEQVAMVACFNPQHFLRLFKKLFSITPYQYLIQNKLRIANQWVTTSDKPISKISMDLGFESMSTFSWTYKNTFGYSPREHRKKLWC